MNANERSGRSLADEADVVEIPRPDDDWVVRRRSSTFIPQKLPKNGKDRLVLSLSY
jgi:hypothetical protein